MEKGLNEEKMLGKVRAIESHVSGGMSIKEACRMVGISDSTYYKWRSRFGGVDRGGLRRLRERGVLATS
ncbi:MAG: transposase, partial [Verrucomicrobiae bacterium]|nr:transposase [Verrucomicrobiae bacterium]